MTAEPNPWRNLRDRIVVPPGYVTIPAAFLSIGPKIWGEHWDGTEIWATEGGANIRRLDTLRIMRRLAESGALLIFVTQPGKLKLPLVAKGHWATKPHEKPIGWLEHAALSSDHAFAYDLPIFASAANIVQVLESILVDAVEPGFEDRDSAEHEARFIELVASDPRRVVAGNAPTSVKTLESGTKGRVSPGRIKGQGNYASDHLIVDRVVALCRADSSPRSAKVRHYIKTLITDIEPTHLDDESKIKRIRRAVLASCPDIEK